FTHEVLGDIGDKQIQMEIVVKVREVDVHSFFVVKSNSRLRNVFERAVSFVVEHAISPKVIGDVHVVPTVVVDVAMAKAESPTALFKSGLLSYVGERTVTVVVI